MAKRFQKIQSSLWKSKDFRRWAGIAAVSLIWLAVLFGVAVPNLRDAHAKHLEIKELETGLAMMDQWVVAGMWLEKSVAANEEQIDTSWDRLFPSKRYREELFLDLAAVADRAEVSDLHLTEINESSMENDNLWLDRPDGDIEEWMSGEITGVELQFYRVQANFHGDLRRVAVFLEGIESIDRALSIHSLDMQPGETGLKVEMKLDVYIRQETQS